MSGCPHCNLSPAPSGMFYLPIITKQYLQIFLKCSKSFKIKPHLIRRQNYRNIVVFHLLTDSYLAKRNNLEVNGSLFKPIKSHSNLYIIGW